MTLSDPVVLCGLNARYVHTNLALRDLIAYTRHHWPAAPQQILLEWTINDQEMLILQRLARQPAAVYAFSCYLWNIDLVRRLSRDLKKVCPDARIVWGGPEAGLRAFALLTEEPAVDLIVSGEGEAAWLAILQTLATPGDPDWATVPNLSWRDESGAIHQNAVAAQLDPADWVFPYNDEDLAALKGRIIYYETSRGCPFRCSYCLSALDRAVRYRPLPQVLAELDQLLAAGLQQVKLVDRTFNCDPARARQIWQHINERADPAGRTNFHFEVAADLLDDPTIDLLNQAPLGLIQLEIGVQTIHPDVLAAINRPMNLEQLARQVTRLRDGGRIHLHLDLIAGLPGEDLTRFGQSLDWVYRLHPHQLQLGFLKVLPGSPMQQQATELGFAWQGQPPYEILRSDALTFADLTLLKAVAQIIEMYINANFCRAALAWLITRKPGPWLALSGLARWAGDRGLLERPLGTAEKCRMLNDYGLASDTELAGDGWTAQVWQDLLRLGYQLSGQKDQPPWLGFTTDARGAALAWFRLRHPGRGRLRVDRLCFDWRDYADGRDLTPADWLICLDLTGDRPLVLDNCRCDDLY